MIRHKRKIQDWCINAVVFLPEGLRSIHILDIFLLCLVDRFFDSRFTQTSIHPVNLKLGKQQTQISLVLEFISGAILQRTQGLNPSFPARRSMLSLCPQRSSRILRTTKLSFPDTLNKIQKSPRLERRDGTCLVPCSSFTHQVRSRGYASLLSSIKTKTRVWCFPSFRLTRWPEVCMWKTESEGHTSKHKKHQSHTLMTSNYALHMENIPFTRFRYIPFRQLDVSPENVALLRKSFEIAIDHCSTVEHSSK